MALLAGLLVAPVAQAAVIAGASGSTTATNTSANWTLFLGKGLSGNFHSAYVHLDDGTAAGYLRAFSLIECDTADYQTPSSQCQSGTTNGTGNLWSAAATVGVAGGKTVAINTAAEHRTVQLDFSIHTEPGCNPGVSCVGTTSTISLDPTKYYALAFSANANADGTGAARGVRVYGITTQLTDAFGNPITCNTTHALPTTTCDGIRTPFYLLTDAGLTSDELSALGYNASQSFAPNWLVPTPFYERPGSGSDYGLTGGSAATGADLGYFGNMLRDLFLWLFSPWDEATANAWTNFVNSLTVHVPFSYVAETYRIFSDFSVASGTVPTATLSFPGLGVASVSFFSSSTITAYAPPGFLAALRALAVAGLWFAFVWHVYHTTRNLLG